MNRHADYRKGKGFTVVELMSVIAVLAILATITTLSYGTWRRSIAQKEVAAEISSLQSTLKNYRNFNSTYPTSLAGVYTPGKNVTVDYKQSGEYYCAAVRSKMSSDLQSYITSDTSDIRDGSCP